MLKEAICQIEQLAEQARSVEPLEIETNDPSKTRVVGVKGDIFTFDVKAPARQHTCATISSFTDAVTKYGTADPADEVFFSSIWVSLDKATGILNDGEDSHRHEHVKLPLFVSPLFATLRSSGRNPMSQSQLLQLLRHDLATAETTPTDIDLAVRKLKFVNHSETEGESVKNVADRMGKAIRNEVSGGAELPERVTFFFKPYPALIDEVKDNVTVECTLTISPENQNIRLCPLPGQIEQAENEAVDLLAAVIKSALPNVPVFCGTP
jgi:hypothetical protein